jgi:hypothetical protein
VRCRAFGGDPAPHRGPGAAIVAHAAGRAAKGVAGAGSVARRRLAPGDVTKIERQEYVAPGSFQGIVEQLKQTKQKTPAVRHG